MTDDRSLERAARSWIDEGPTQAPDRAVEAALLTIKTTPQERNLRIPWRTHSMQTRYAVAAAIVAITIGALTLGRLFAVPGPGATPGATASAPAPTPGRTPNQAIGYPDLPGWILFEHFGRAPDGSTPEFVPDNRMIWLVRADGTGLHELAPGAPTEGKVSPDISPDGRTVAFATWNEPNLIYEVGIDGGAPRLLSTDCSGLDDCRDGDPAYSPDGKQLAFVRESGTGAGRATRIMVRVLATGAVFPLEGTRTEAPRGYVSQPSWSPDGTRIVYYQSLQTEADAHVTKTQLFIADVGPSIVMLEVPTPPGAWAADPDWSPDGTKIVFSTAPNRETEGWAQSEGAPSGGIWLFHVSGSPVGDADNLEAVCGTCLGGGIAPSWTADGRILFWGYRTWALVNPDGSGLYHVNQPKLTWFGDDLGYGYAAVLQPTP